MIRIPSIDLEPARCGSKQDRRRAAEQLDHACREIGFLTITGHGVPDHVVNDLRRAAQAFFALPEAQKRLASHPMPGTNRGYHAVGGETLSAAHDEAGPPDLKAFYHIGPVDISDHPYYTSTAGQAHFLPNIWPAIPVDFASTATTYYRAMSELIVLLMRLAALALGVHEHFFDDKIDRSIGTMRLNYYPAQTVLPRPGQLRASAHTDYGGFTILSGEDAPGGLQVMSRQGQWIDVPTVPTNFVVNIGDLLMRWTNDRWLSNLHRVVNPPSDGGLSQSRLSIAFFNHPNYDVLIECLAPPGEAKYEPVLSGTYRDLKYAKTGLTPVP
jgi:isopenicillin N synthase-like dioxygenase